MDLNCFILTDVASNKVSPIYATMENPNQKFLSLLVFSSLFRSIQFIYFSHSWRSNHIHYDFILSFNIAYSLIVAV